MVDSSTQCYYLDASRNQQGPASVGDLARLARSGAVTRDTMVWFAGMPDWRPAGQVNELASLFAPPATAMRPPMPPVGAPGPRPAGPPAGGVAAYDPPPGGYAAGGQGGAPYAGKSLGFGEAVSTCLRKYADFNGRAARPEYWYFALAQCLLSIAVMILGGIIGAISPNVGSVLTTLGILALIFGLLIPNIAVTVRRLHDTDKSGWWYLVAFVPFGGIVLLIFMCLPGTQGQNSYGPQP